MIIAFIILVPSILVAFDITSSPLSEVAECAVATTIAAPKKAAKGSRAKTNKISPVAAQYFAAVREKDKKGPTTNVHILAQRHLDGKTGPSLSIINTVLAPLGLSTTAAILEALRLLTGISVNLSERGTNSPDMTNFNGAIGDGRTTKKKGVYICTPLETGVQYVGGTLNAGSRVRSYLKPGQPSSGLIRPALVEYGLAAFKVEFLEIPSSLYTPGLETVLEQYYMFLLDPGFNVIKVAGSGGPTLFSEEQLLKAIQLRGTPMYMYEMVEGVLTLIQGF